MVDSLSRGAEVLLSTLLQSGSLKFGTFVTKSGRTSPHFVDFGAIQNGPALFAIADVYAEVIAEKWGDKVDVLYGPAYKGISLAVMTSYALSLKLGKAVGFTFNRKERKDHGEGGLFVGQPLKAGAKVVVVEDVLTGGTSLRETHATLAPLQTSILGVVIGLDREERGSLKVSAKSEIEALYRCEVACILKLSSCLSFLKEKTWRGKIWLNADQFERSKNYLKEFGSDL